jgi:hypothetical protein
MKKPAHRLLAARKDKLQHGAPGAGGVIGVRQPRAGPMDDPVVGEHDGAAVQRCLQACGPATHEGPAASGRLYGACTRVQAFRWFDNSPPWVMDYCRLHQARCSGYWP